MVNTILINFHEVDPKAPAILYRDRILSYGEVKQEWEFFAESILRHKTEAHIVNLCFQDPCLQMIAQLACIQMEIAFCVRQSNEASFWGSKVAPVKVSEENFHFFQHKSDLDFPDIKDGISLKNVAYFMSTSGSSGVSKLAIIEKKSLHAFLHSMQIFFSNVGMKSIYSSFSANFDPFMAMGILALQKRALLVPRESSQLYRIREDIKNWNIDTISFVPSVYISLLSDKAEDFHQIRNCLFTGEKFYKACLDKVEEQFPLSRIFNLYGPVENCIWSTGYEILGNEETKDIPIGKAFSSVEFSLDTKTQELVLKGDQLFSGYWHGAKIKKENEFATKDKCLTDSKGNLVYVHRLEQSLKLRGRFVNWEDIEKTFFEIYSVPCVAYEKNNKLNFALESEVSEEWKLKWEHPIVTKADLGHLIQVKFPRTKTGKLDRKALIKEIYEEQ